MRVSVVGNRWARAWTRAVGLLTCIGRQFPGARPHDQRWTALMPNTKTKRFNRLALTRRDREWHQSSLGFAAQAVAV
jgi:hypothetical protein